MRAMVFTGTGHPLQEVELPRFRPGPGQLLLEVSACGVCRTDLHIVDGELAEPKLPLVLGHQIVGRVTESGAGAARFAAGQRVGVPWLGWTCGGCRYCLSGRENLCDHARFTGYDIDGGFVEETVADERFCFPIPEGYPDLQAAPLLCAGLIGYRALVLTGDAERVGLYGFGAAAHIICQVARWQGRRVFAFTRDGDAEGQEFARSLGAEWAGCSLERSPEELGAAIIFAPVGELVPAALAAVAKGGSVVCAGIHMSDIPSFPYELLWGERAVRSVANLTRRDGEEVMALAPQVPVRTEVEVFPLAEANAAFARLRSGGGARRRGVVRRFVSLASVGNSQWPPPHELKRTGRPHRAAWCGQAAASIGLATDASHEPAGECRGMRNRFRGGARSGTRRISRLRGREVERAYRFVEHVGEVELELEAADEAGIFEAAVAAFAELVATGEEREPARREIELTAGDRAMLLVDWLSELVFLAEVEGFVPERVAAFELVDNRLRATVVGRRDHPRHLVKAVTLNKLEFTHEGTIWHGRVVLDV